MRAALVACGLLAVCTALAATDALPPGEEPVFRALNDVALPLALVWPVMQLGNVVAVPLAALVAAGLRRWRLAVALAVAGLGAYVAAKVLKRLVDRGRPAELLPDVDLHGMADAGRGFPSGHAAVAAALAGVVLPLLGRRGRALVLALVALVCLARVHVGAHLPLDVVGGAALGAVTAGAALLLVRPR